MLQAFTLQLKKHQTYEYGQYEKAAKIRCKYNRQLPPQDCAWSDHTTHPLTVPGDRKPKYSRKKCYHNNSYLKGKVW